MIKSQKVYVAERTYSENLSAYMQADAEKRDVRSISQYMELIEKDTGETFNATAFRNWFMGRTIPRIYYLLVLAKFYKCDIYDLIYNVKDQQDVDQVKSGD